MTTFQNKQGDKSGIVLHFCQSLTSGLTEDGWILISVSAFNLLQYHTTSGKFHSTHQKEQM